MLDHAARNPEEGGRDEERQNPGDQRQLLDEVSTVEEVFRRGDQVDLSVDLADRYEGADDGSEEDGTATQPDVEEQQELEGGLSLRKLAVSI